MLRVAEGGKWCSVYAHNTIPFNTIPFTDYSSAVKNTLHYHRCVIFPVEDGEVLMII